MPTRMLHDSMGRRLRRPWHWSGVAAIIMAVLTALFGIQAGLSIAAANKPLEHEVRIIVEGEQDYNISQGTVDAQLAGNPVRSSIPLTLVLTDRWLTGDELLRGEVPENTIILSSQLENLEQDYDDPQFSEQRFDGAGVDYRLMGSEEELDDASYDIAGSFTKNVSVGHGPKAVIAAAHTAAVATGDTTPRSMLFWFTVVGASAMITAAFFARSLSFRRRWSSRHRRLAAAQRKLARVVLDLEALEATYYATVESRRPQGFTKAWSQLQQLSLSLARREDAVVSSVFDRKNCLDQTTNILLNEFETDARKLTSLADSLMGAGSVHADLAGTGSVFDKLSTPINDAATKLLIRLENAPGQMVRGTDIEQLRDALGSLLQAARGNAQHSAAVQRWAAAEKELAQAAHRIIGRLRHYPHGKRPTAEPLDESLDDLRATLGLGAASAKGALHRLRVANSMTRAILGDTLDSDRQESAPKPKKARKPAHHKELVRGTSRLVKYGLLAGLLVASLICAGLVVASLPQAPKATYEGSGQGMVLQIDDKAKLVDESEIRRYMHEDFAERQDLLIAVRDAESYLEFTRIEGSEYRDSTPQSVREAIWRIKDEYPDRQDPASGELDGDLTIIPLLITDAGDGIMPGLISGAVISGEASWGSTSGWDYGSIHESKYPAMEAANAAEDFAVVLKRAGYEKPDYNVSLLYWMLVFMLFFSVLNLVQVVQYLLGATSRFSRFSRGSRSVQRSRRKLEQLALGLEETQINAVAVLGASSSGRADEAGQRLFERALMMAWREAEELSTMTLGQRLSPGYERRTAHLAQLVDLLGERDADVARRANALVMASRGAGGDAPAPVKLA